MNQTNLPGNTSNKDSEFVPISTDQIITEFNPSNPSPTHETLHFTNMSSPDASPSKKLSRASSSQKSEEKRVAFQIEDASGQSKEEASPNKHSAKSNPFVKRQESGRSTTSFSPILKKKESGISSMSGLDQYVPTTNCKSTQAGVGKVQDDMAMILTNDMYTIDMPVSALPKDVRKGNVLRITVERNIAEEEKRKDQILDVQKLVLGQENLFKVFDSKMQMFMDRREQALQISNGSKEKNKAAINQVTKALSQGTVLYDEFDNDKIIMRPKALADEAIQSMDHPAEKKGFK